MLVSTETEERVYTIKIDFVFYNMICWAVEMINMSHIDTWGKSKYHRNRFLYFITSHAWNIMRPDCLKRPAPSGADKRRKKDTGRKKVNSVHSWA